MHHPLVGAAQAHGAHQDKGQAWAWGCWVSALPGAHKVAAEGGRWKDASLYIAQVLPLAIRLRQCRSDPCPLPFSASCTRLIGPASYPVSLISCPLNPYPFALRPPLIDLATPYPAPSILTESHLATSGLRSLIQRAAPRRSAIKGARVVAIVFAIGDKWLI